MSVVPLEGGPPLCARCWARAWGLGQVLAEARRINGITGDNTRDGPEASSDLQVLVPEDPERGLFSLLPVLRLSPGRRASSRSPELLQSTEPLSVPRPSPWPAAVCVPKVRVTFHTQTWSQPSCPGVNERDRAFLYKGQTP